MGSGTVHVDYLGPEEAAAIVAGAFESPI